MGRRIRHFEPGVVQFITTRCFQSRYLLRPSESTNELVGGVLAKAIEIYKVDVFAFAFGSNHFHLLAKAPDEDPCRLSKFVGYLKSNIARAVGPTVKWKNAFFERRYSVAPVLDEGAFQYLVRYFLAHGVKEGLVRRVDEWPGLSSLPEHRGAKRSFSWFDRTGWYRSGAAVRGASVPASPVVLRLAPHALTNRAAIEALVTAIDGSVPRDFVPLGRAAVLAYDPHFCPAHTKRGRQPLCHASDDETRRIYRERRRAYDQQYRSAAVRLSAGDTTADFPANSFRPPLPPSWLAALVRLEKPRLLRLTSVAGSDGVYEGFLLAG